MIESKVTGSCQLAKLYSKAQDNVGRNGAGAGSIDKQTNNNYISWKWKVHREFYRLIAEAGIYIEGA